MLEKYYNKETNTLTVHANYNSSLKELPLGTKIIIFEEVNYKGIYSKFNQPVDNLPNMLTHLTFGNYFNKIVDYCRIC